MNTVSESNGIGPLIIQSDMTLLLEVDHTQYEQARDSLATFAEMVKSPEYIHTYRLSQLSLWNAASAGIKSETVLKELARFAKHEIPPIVSKRVLDWGKRYGQVVLRSEDGQLVLSCDDIYVAETLYNDKHTMEHCTERLDPLRFVVRSDRRGQVKQALIALEYPAEDLAGYGIGTPLTITLRDETLGGIPFGLRNYQQEGVNLFYQDGKESGGNGVIVLPCGAGKTIVGMGVLEKYQMETLILTTSITAVRQWIAEILDKTHLTTDQVGEYSGERKEIRPITVSTYQIVSPRENHFAHFSVMEERAWGLIIYDEVHTLPAPLFRLTADLQARRRLGLTATLIREDGRQSDVFSLIGPKRYEVPWKVLERMGQIAKAECFEVRVPLAQELRMVYAQSDKRAKFRLASENYVKSDVLKLIMKRHPNSQMLVIGQYIDQLKGVAAELNVPLITGQTSNKKRDEIYEKFRTGEIPVVVVSKVANYAIDLPDANVAVEISGSFGSRQEEAQRLGRILRPKRGENKAWFYTLCSQDTCEQDFAAHRQLFLTEQGYPYTILDSVDMLE